VSQLLTLARAEPGGPHEPLTPTDLAEAARQAVADVGALGDAKSINSRMQAHPNCIV